MRSSSRSSSRLCRQSMHRYHPAWSCLHESSPDFDIESSILPSVLPFTMDERKWRLGRGPREGRSICHPTNTSRKGKLDVRCWVSVSVPRFSRSRCLCRQAGCKKIASGILGPFLGMYNSFPLSTFLFSPFSIFEFRLLTAGN